MKTVYEIQDEITAILYQFGITPADAPLMAVSAYVSKQIMDARQDVFNTVIETINKKGGDSDD